jgi:hypothetical protein
VRNTGLARLLVVRVFGGNQKVLAHTYRVCANVTTPTPGFPLMQSQQPRPEVAIFALSWVVGQNESGDSASKASLTKGGAGCTSPKKRAQRSAALVIVEKFYFGLLRSVSLLGAVRSDHIHSGDIERLVSRRTARLAAGSGRWVGIFRVRGAAGLLRSVNDNMVSNM